jgi:hypothetical protein
MADVAESGHGDMDTKPICRTTHRQLLDGTCPWCAAMVVDGQAMASDEARQLVVRVWNIDALESDLDALDDEVRMDTVSNLILHSPPFDEAVPLLAKALNDMDDGIRENAGQALSGLGRRMADDQANELEKQVVTGNHELALRLILVAYYVLGKRKSKAAALARRNHILWLIEHAPELEATGRPDCLLLESEDRDGYRQGKSLWLANINKNPNKSSILANAARFFTLNDSALSEQLLQQGLSIEPDKPYWHEQLGHLYTLRSLGNCQDEKMMATKSYAAFEEAEQLRNAKESLETDEVGRVEAILSRIHTLPALAKSAFAACEYEHAANYASELLSLSNSTELSEFVRNDGNAVHYGHLVLGRVALEMGNVDEAKRHLLASGRTHGSPTLSSFGPNMCLARDLLKRGERDVVLEYLQLCLEFWAHGAEKLSNWTKQIESGDTPDFGANLAY